MVLIVLLYLWLVSVLTHPCWHLQSPSTMTVQYSIKYGESYVYDWWVCSPTRDGACNLLALSQYSILLSMGAAMVMIGECVHPPMMELAISMHYVPTIRLYSMTRNVQMFGEWTKGVIKGEGWEDTNMVVYPSYGQAFLLGPTKQGFKIYLVVLLRLHTYRLYTIQIEYFWTPSSCYSLLWT